MKVVKYITVALFLIGTSTTTIGQEKAAELFRVPLSSPNSPGKLELDQVAGSIKVTGYDGNEVVVAATFGGNKGHRRSKDRSSSNNGMKRIANSSLDVSAEEKNNVVRLSNGQVNKVVNFEIQVPRKFGLKLSTVNNGDIHVVGVDGEMEISNVNGEITLEEVSGSASADTVNGDVTVGFVSITEDTPMAFSSLNGDLEITFPKNVKAHIKAKSDQGLIYTDFDMKVADKKPVVKKNSSGSVYQIKVEKWVRGDINGGGAEMLFKTFNGDIFVKSR
ncbi:MAG: DUF4097 family beta strand repeat-containing protein [Bacteroidota bacterium]